MNQEKKKKNTYTQQGGVLTSTNAWMLNYQFITSATAAIYYGHGYIKIQSINQFLPNNNKLMTDTILTSI